MIAQGWGRIINLSSMLGTVGLAERPAYTAAKGGVIQLTRTLAIEWAPHGINVNALAPGPFATELNRPLLDNPAVYRAFADRIPLNRWGEPEELAGLGERVTERNGRLEAGPISGGGYRLAVTLPLTTATQPVERRYVRESSNGSRPSG